jgi:glycyl-tRNA synthetase
MQQKPLLTREVMLKRKEHLEQLTKRRFIYQPGFALYNGVAGLYDYGPVGCAIKNNVEQFWREHFIIEEDLLEVCCTCLTPEPVLKASGHVDKFTDLLVTDAKTKAPYRADKVVTEVLEARINDKKTSEELKAEYTKVLSLIDSYKE